MRFTTTRKEQLFDRLVRISGGNPDLVEEALREAGSLGGPARLEDVVKYIMEHRNELDRQQVAVAG